MRKRITALCWATKTDADQASAVHTRRTSAFDWYKSAKNEERRFQNLVAQVERLASSVNEKETLDFLVRSMCICFPRRTS